MKTCRNGHPLTEDNLRLRRGRRECRTCHRALVARYRRRRAALRGPRPVATVCKHGHDLTDPANVYVQPDGHRRCRVCKRDHRRRYPSRPRPPRPVIVDEVVVDRLVAGRPVVASRRERLAAWSVLEARGLSARVIAGCLGVTPRTVVRWRARQGASA